jgi:hypothetical protein
MLVPPKRARVWIFVLLATLAACAQVNPLSEPPAIAADAATASVPGAVEATASRAFFPSFPDRLLTAAVQACNSPGQRPESPSANTVRCLSLPTPDVAAALILSYDGTIADLPLYVVSFDTIPSDGGYIVTADSYVTVPQTDGTIRTVRLMDPVVASEMMDLLTTAGGTAVSG